MIRKIKLRFKMNSLRELFIVDYAIRTYETGKRASRLRLLLFSSVVVCLISSCAGNGTAPAYPVATPRPILSQPAGMAITLQADALLTSAWSHTLTPEIAQDVTGTVSATPFLEGPHLVSRKGDCSVPANYALHFLEGFCIAAPSTWLTLNLDGGIAAFLNTTPGQAISFQPDWANNTAVCQLMVYLARDDFADYLDTRHAQVSRRSDLDLITPIRLQLIGLHSIPGFTWQAGAESGGVFADTVNPDQALHVSFGGTTCTLDQLTPVLETFALAK